jgi:hypothetical protein
MNKDEKRPNLYKEFSKIPDFRRKQGQTHELPVILLIVTMAIMSGYNGQRAMGDFVKRNRKQLLKVFKPKKNKLPSYQTIARVLANIDFLNLIKIFTSWASKYVSIDGRVLCSMDGKAIGGTVKNPNNKHQEYTNLVSIFASERKQVIGIGKVKNKSSEIPLVQEMIKILDLEGMIFTLDALHCQKETTKTIIKSKNDYIIGVKGNQSKLLNCIKKT